MSKNPPNDRFWTGKRVTVTGGHGFLGRRVVSLIESLGAKVTTFRSSEYNLTKQADIARMYADQRPEIVIHLAANGGRIGANRNNPGSFFYQNRSPDLEPATRGCVRAPPPRRASAATKPRRPSRCGPSDRTHRIRSAWAAPRSYRAGTRWTVCPPRPAAKPRPEAQAPRPTASLAASST